MTISTYLLFGIRYRTGQTFYVEVSIINASSSVYLVLWKLLKCCRGFIISKFAKLIVKTVVSTAPVLWARIK